MTTTQTPNLGLTKATPSSGEPWSSGQHILDAFDKIDRQYQGVFHVMAYGAAGDGVADDTSALQGALDAAGTYAAAHGGATVRIPAGKYLVAAATRLTVKSGVTIDARDAYIFKGGVPTIGILANFVVGTDTFSGYAGNSNITILGGIWDGKAQNVAADVTFDVIDFNHCRGILVKDVVIRNTPGDHALEFNSTDGGTAINCRFEGFKDTTSGLTRQFSEAVQIDLAASGSSSIGSYDGTHAKNILVQGCYMGPAVDGSGCGSFGKLVGSHTTAAGAHYLNIRIIGNVVDGALNVGIGAYNWTDSIIANNVVYNTGSHGIRVTVPDPVAAGFSVLATNVVVSGNTVDTTVASGGGVGIEILGYTSTAGIKGVTVSGNTVRNADTLGIFCQLVYDLVVAGNIVDTTGSNGINVTAVQYALVADNWISGPASNYCIFLGQVTSPSTVSTTDALLTGNVCLLGSGATAGIRLATGTTLCLVTGNTVRKNGGASAIAVSCNAGGGTTNTVDGNDFTGFGDVTATITVSSGTVNKSFPAATNIGRNLG